MEITFDSFCKIVTQLQQPDDIFQADEDSEVIWKLCQ
jgi:hypothetical protein